VIDLALISASDCAVGGLLNATFGNTTEMIICVFALRNNMVRVVQLSLLGSILSNMLLVLGCAFLSGGIANSKKEQKFDKVRGCHHQINMIIFLFYSDHGSDVGGDMYWRCMQGAAHLNSSLLLMAVMCVLFPAALHATRTELHLGESELVLSRVTSCVMLVAYAGYIYFQLYNPRPLREEVTYHGYRRPHFNN
jgi:Ca2+:H+ antiporter